MSFADPNELDEEPPADADGPDPETTTTPPETVELEWVAESDTVSDGQLPLDEAIKANAQVLRSKADNFALDRIEEDTEGLHAEIAELREERNNLRDEVEELRGIATDIRGLRERLDSLEGWKGNVTRRLNASSENIRKLLTVSNLDAQGLCLECNDAPSRSRCRSGSRTASSVPTRTATTSPLNWSDR
jgi:seryl-tRNA synthetase